MITATAITKTLINRDCTFSFGYSVEILNIIDIPNLVIILYIVSY